MDKDIVKAMEDITIIKRVIERTKEDVTKLATFFIWIGIINFVDIAFNVLANLFIVPSTYNNSVLQIVCYVKFIMIFAGYILIFLCYRRVMKSCNNEISLGLLKIWGIIFIGLFIFTFIYRNFIPKNSMEFYYTLLTNIIVFQFVSVILGCYMIGIFTKRKLIVICSTILSIVFFALFFSRSYSNIKFSYEIAYSDILMDLILSIGLFLLGLYLKRQPGGVLNGNSNNTGSISDEA